MLPDVRSRISASVIAISAVRSFAPLSDVHVFSSTEGHYGSADFDDFRAVGCTVHLDGDPFRDWAHMAAADVLRLETGRERSEMRKRERGEEVKARAGQRR